MNLGGADVGFGTLPTESGDERDKQPHLDCEFSGNSDGLDGFSSLKDGVYDVAIDAAKVHPFGDPTASMAAISTTVLYRLFGNTGASATPPGDATGNDFHAIVTTADNLAFRSAFNNPTKYAAFLDFNGDGLINSADNLQFRNRFNKSLTWRTYDILTELTTCALGENFDPRHFYCAGVSLV